MNRYCDIICFSLSRWDAPISSPALSLAKEMANSNRVFYIDHPYSLKDYLRERNRPEVRSRKPALLHGKHIYHNPPGLPASLTVVTSKLVLPVNYLPAGPVYRSLSALNDKVILQTIRRVISDFAIKDFIYVNFFDPYFVRRLPADIRPLRTIYQSMDDISQVAYSNRHGARLEEEIIRSFDYTLCTSHELTRLKSAFSPNVYFHPNAADTSIFQRAWKEDLPKPAELADIHTPIIGFTGSIEYRTDFELLRKVALAHSDKTLVLVGPVQTDEHIKAGLDKMPNVRFLGPRKITELPAYLKYFDCALIPYRKNTLTKSIYPLKINEYLAAARPVVAVNFSEDMYSFHEVAYVEDTHEDFIAAIGRAIAEDNPDRRQARMAVAAQNTWKARVDRFWEIISKEPRQRDLP